MIDNFIRERIREANKDFSTEKDALKININPEGDYMIAADDLAVVLSRTMPSS